VIVVSSVIGLIILAILVLAFTLTPERAESLGSVFGSLSKIITSALGREKPIPYVLPQGTPANITSIIKSTEERVKKEVEGKVNDVEKAKKSLQQSAEREIQSKIDSLKEVQSVRNVPSLDGIIPSFPSLSYSQDQVADSSGYVYRKRTRVYG
jgi:predicted PurR-regulated permease PerM